MNNLPSTPILRGEFVALLAGSGTVTSGVANVLITPPAGQRVRLTHLSTSGAPLPNVSILFGSTTLVDEADLYGDFPAWPARFSVGSFQAYAAGAPPSGNHKYVTGKTDEVLNITSAASVATTMYYAYEFGE